MDNLFINATKGIQLLLQVDNPTLKVDGYFGSFTQSCYDRSSSATQALANAYSLRVAGMTISSLRSKYVVDNSVVSAKGGQLKYAKPISETKLKAVISRVLPLISIMTEDDLLTFVRNEAYSTVVDGERIYEAASRRIVKGKPSKYGGLMQFDKTTWDAVREAIPERRKKYPDLPDLPSYDEGVYDPFSAVLAAAVYASMNRKTVRALAVGKKYNLPQLKTFTFTGGDFYAMHNQGAGGYLDMVSNITRFKQNAWFQAQSPEAKNLLTASAQAVSNAA